MTFRFIGTFSEVGRGAERVAFRRFGEEVEFDPAKALELVRGGLPIIPGETFDLVGFTEDELKRLRRGRSAALMPDPARPEASSELALKLQELDEFFVQHRQISAADKILPSADITGFEITYVGESELAGQRAEDI